MFFWYAYSIVLNRHANRLGLFVQGNLDPLLLVTGGAMLDQQIDKIIGALSDGAYIFNLGHGIVPQTPPEHVTQLVNRVVNQR